MTATATTEVTEPELTIVESEPVIIAHEDLFSPDGRRLYLDDSMFIRDKKGLHYPRFSVQEVAKCFFGKSSDWLRWRMRPDAPDKKTGERKHPEGFFELDGEKLEIKRLPPPKGRKNAATTARYYTLADIEKMAHALAQQGSIDGAQLANIVLAVRVCARTYGVL